jgi:hypothetical protein
VPNDAQIGQPIADGKTFDNLSDEFWMVPSTSAYSSRIAGLTQASIKPACASSKMRAEKLYSPGNVTSSRMQVQERLARYGLARRSARARRLASTNATASRSVIVLPRFWRCALAGAEESLSRTTLPSTTAVVYMTPADAKRLTDASDGSHPVARKSSVQAAGRTDPRIIGGG